MPPYAPKVNMAAAFLSPAQAPPTFLHSGSPSSSNQIPLRYASILVYVLVPPYILVLIVAFILLLSLSRTPEKRITPWKSSRIPRSSRIVAFSSASKERNGYTKRELVLSGLSSSFVIFSPISGKSKLLFFSLYSREFYTV